ncbi:MAG: single-stranded DNA-binding protein [Anaerolineales bacterium]|jgi:single-strand DNA-binding protein
MYHTIIIVGNLGRDPEMRYTSTGQAVTDFPVASNRRYTNNEGQQIDETTWFRVSVWGKQAESCNQYLNKGSRVLIEGRLRPDTNGGPRVFERSDGTHGASFEVTAQTVRFLSTRTEASMQTGEFSSDAPASDADEEIPF